MTDTVNRADRADRVPETPGDQLPAPPQPIILSTRRDVTLVVQGVEKKADAIEKLAAKAKEEGYHRAAREIEIDAARIREHIMPELQEQRQLPIASHESSMEAITHLLHSTLNRAVEASPRPRLTDIETAVALRVADLVERVYKAAWGLGYAARRDDIDLVAMLCADQARAAADERENGKQHGVGG